MIQASISQRTSSLNSKGSVHSSTLFGLLKYFSARFAVPECVQEDSDVLDVLLNCEMDLHHSKLQSWEVYFPSLPFIHVPQNILVARWTVVHFKQNKKCKKYSDFSYMWYCFKENCIWNQGNACGCISPGPVDLMQLSHTWISQWSPQHFVFGGFILFSIPPDLKKKKKKRS